MTTEAKLREALEAMERVKNAKNAARFIRSDRIFEFTGSQMAELSAAINALEIAALALPATEIDAPRRLYT